MSDIFEKKMANKYRSYKDLYDRLQGTYVRYDGKPYYVYNITKTPKLHLVEDIDLPPTKIEGSIVNVSPVDEKLDVSAFELGYVNQNKSVLYCVRGAGRHYKQGTCLDHITGRGTDNQHRGVSHTSFRRMLQEDYPSLEMARALLLSKEVNEIAISKSVAFKRMDVGVIVVYFRHKEVAWMTPEMEVANIKEMSHRWIIESEFRKVGVEIS